MPRQQSGIALLAFLLILITGMSFTVLRGLNSAASGSYRDEQTWRALAEAKAALVGYAAAANVVPVGNCNNNCPRPGDLPCPDRDDDGVSGITGSPPRCGNASGSTGQSQRLGRLPWKTLGLPDVRDGSGERLWYAVSNNFKNNTRARCASVGDAGCLNSDSCGTITVRDAAGAVIHDGSNLCSYDGSNPDTYMPSGATAVIIAPGPVLWNQNRDCSGSSCQPSNFLDAGAGEDNADFADGDADNGFVQGEIFDLGGNVIVNDRVLAITFHDLMPLLEKRVVGEVLACLRGYATANGGRYPWAANVSVSDADFDDDSETRFGRLPDRPFDNTRADGSIADTWSVGCLVDDNQDPTQPETINWWRNWREHVFYALAEAFQPGSTPVSCGSVTPETCLRVDPPSPSADKGAVVIVAGKALENIDSTGYDQKRSTPSEKLDVRNYLEAENGDAVAAPYDDHYTSGPAPTPFNDVTCKNGACL